MHRNATLLMCSSALIFVISSVLLSFAQIDLDITQVYLDGRQVSSGPNLLAAVLLNPTEPATWLLLIAVWVVVLFLVVQTFREIGTARAYPVADMLLLAAAFMAGAIWPWVAQSFPLLGFMICVMMLLAMISASSRRFSDGRLGRNPAIGIFTGWVSILTFTAFSSFVDDVTPIPPELASLVGAVLACIAAIAIQMRIPENAYYTITVMFAFLAIAATMIEAAPLIAVISVLSIAALTFLLVRVTT
ncbi:hypothetical protein SAMN05421538_106203 [Paracoccus isoporae]|uniref:Uncharacterized protein n=2 Tax=Paracoccus isoporae TaxID=591205 RepID=A0A1G7CUY5_9RHOB|nr:hypothetical protein SAMN05421538_106203 [Paracoccus isoporae]